MSNVKTEGNVDGNKRQNQLEERQKNRMMQILNN